MIYFNKIIFNYYSIMNIFTCQMVNISLRPSISLANSNKLDSIRISFCYAAQSRSRRDCLKSRSYFIKGSQNFKALNANGDLDDVVLSVCDDLDNVDTYT